MLSEEDELTKQLSRLPDLAAALREASPEVQRQVFEAFELQILYDKAGRTIEISATVSDAVANAFEKQKALPGRLAGGTERGSGGPIHFSLPPRENSRGQQAPT